MIEKKPLVSVLIPSYNHAAYILTCVSSVLNQSYSNVELVVVDDGSKDDSADIIKRFEGLEYVKLSIRKHNIGLIGTLNEALALSSGEYVAIIASDDFWAPEKLSRQVERMALEDELRIIFTEGVEVDENDRPIRSVVYTKRQLQKWFFSDVLLKADLPPASIMCRRKDIIGVGGFSDRYRIEDLPLWLSLLKDGGYAAVIREPLAFYRSHSTNMHNTSSDMILSQHFKIISDFAEGHPEEAKILEEWSLRNANFVARHDKAAAVRYLSKAWYAVWDRRWFSALFKVLFSWQRRA